MIDIDQSPIGRTPRSNPATYTKAFDPIRQLFAQVPEARTRGYDASRFSFNVKGGRCENCNGEGLMQIEMQFLPDLFVPCEVCGGARYNRETLDILYRSKNIAEVLDMTVEEALVFFDRVPAIREKLQTLADVGLGYVKLGQPATTLSGGEAQRIKLATELARRATGRTLYILDEPTTGLHFADIERLLQVLQRLVDAGNTVLVIEHNLDVIKSADWIIDMGPEGGDAGGQVIAAGTPEQIAQVAESHTGAFLRKILVTLHARPQRRHRDPHHRADRPALRQPPGLPHPPPVIGMHQVRVDLAAVGDRARVAQLRVIGDLADAHTVARTGLRGDIAWRGVLQACADLEQPRHGHEREPRHPAVIPHDPMQLLTRALDILRANIAPVLDPHRHAVVRELALGPAALRIQPPRRWPFRPRLRRQQATARNQKHRNGKQAQALRSLIQSSHNASPADVCFVNK